MIHKPVSASIRVASSNVEMVEAIRQAKATLDIFFKAFDHPTKPQSGFHLKVQFEQDGQVEHIWLGDLQLGREAGSGVVANQARMAGFGFGKRVTFPLSAVTDWMYTDDGELAGGFTTKVLAKLRERYMADRLMSGLHRRFGPGSGQFQAFR